MDVHDLTSRFAVALGIGLLIGLERGWRTREARPGSRAAGIRTFAIPDCSAAPLGALAMALRRRPWAPASLAAASSSPSALPPTAAVHRDFHARAENGAGGALLGHQRDRRHAHLCARRLPLVGDMRLAAAAAVAAAGLLASARSFTAGWRASPGRNCARAGAADDDVHRAADRAQYDRSGRSGALIRGRSGSSPSCSPASPSRAMSAVKYFGARCRAAAGGGSGGLASSTAVTIANARRAAAAKARRVCSRPASRSPRRSCSFVCGHRGGAEAEPARPGRARAVVRRAGGDRVRGRLGGGEGRATRNIARSHFAIRSASGRSWDLPFCWRGHRARPGLGEMFGATAPSLVRSSSGSPTSIPLPCR